MRVLVCSLLCVLAGWANAFTPLSGGWIVDNEYIPNQSGRGFQVEIQGEIGGVAFYGYTQSGDPIFFIGAGIMDGASFTAPLIAYGGGNAFGQPFQPSHPIGNAGNVTFSFDSGITGWMTLPGEAPLRISRGNFGYPAGYDALRGEWTLVYDMGELVADRFTLSQHFVFEGVDLIASPDGRAVCERFDPPEDAIVYCARLQADETVTPLMFQFFGDVGEGLRYTQDWVSSYPLRAWRTRSATGRSTGILGDPLDPLAISDASTQASVATSQAVDVPQRAWDLLDAARRHFNLR